MFIQHNVGCSFSWGLNYALDSEKWMKDGREEEEGKREEMN